MTQMVTLYKRFWKLLIGISKGSLIDFETTGTDPHQDEIITFGCIKGRGLKIIQRKWNESEVAFLKHIRRDLKKHPQPFYAYNVEFERDFIKTKFGMKAKFIDLMKPWRTKAERTPCPHCGGSGLLSDRICEHCQGRGRFKWPKLGELISEPEEYFGEKIIEGKDVPVLWNKYLGSKDFNYLKPIIRHNQIDLLRELVLLIHDQ